MSEELAADGATVEFTPSAGWDWYQWDGKTQWQANPTAMTVSGKDIYLPSALTNLQTAILGKLYTSAGFGDVPGSVITAVLTVDQQSLSDGLTVGGQPAATNKTTGTFLITVAPSVKAASPPVPDPQLARNGTWKVISSGQSRVTLGG